jgi:predicted nucleic acid-binding protein
MRFVADASTLILLAKAEILLPAAEEYPFWIPDVVKDECLAKKTRDARMISAALDAGRIELRPSGASGVIRTLRRDFGLHRGEAEAVEMALREKLPLAVDDYPAIKACRILQIKFATAIHFAIALKRIGRLDVNAAEARLEKLAHFGRYSSRILQDALGRIRGEEQ